MTKERKTIAITLSFFTDDLPSEIDFKKQKIKLIAWSNGHAYLPVNNEKGIKTDSKHFQRPEDLPQVIRELFKKANIALLDANKKHN